MLDQTQPEMGARSKGWIPSVYADEICPPCRPAPSDWLVIGDVLRLAPSEDDIPDAGPGPVVREGDVVKFDELTEFPSIRAVRNGPRDYILLSPVPVGATCFCLPWEPDTLGHSIEDFMRDNSDVDAFELGEPFEILAYDWSTHSFVLRAGRLIPAAADG